jgi:PAS domain S-box-containing protein
MKDSDTKSEQQGVPLRIDTLPLGCIVWDMNFCVRSWNPAAERIFGFTAEEALGKSLLDLLSTRDSHNLVTAAWKDILEGYSSAHSTREHLTKDGRTISCEWIDTPLREKSGEPTGILSIVQDVTERRHVEQRLRVSEDRYRDLVESSEDLICTHDLNGKILSCNPLPAKMLGYDVSTLTQVSIQDILAPQVRDQFTQYIQEIRTRGFAKGTMLAQARSGEIRVWEYHNTLRTEGVAVPIVRGMAHDVTERRRIGKALQESEDRYRRFFEEDLAGAFIAQPDGKLLACNPAFASIFGFESVLAANEKSLPSLYENEKDGLQLMAALTKLRRLTNYETVLRHREGHPLHVIANIAGRFDPSGKLIQVEGTIIDNTEQRKLEEQLRRAQKLEAVGQLAGGFAHEFNNLLMAISAHCELFLMKCPTDFPLLNSVEEIHKASQRAADLTRQLLAFSRKQWLERQIVDPNELVRGMTATLKNMIADSELVTTYGQGVGRVEADPEKMKQVILNLAMNASDAMPGGGKLSISTSKALLSPELAKRYPGTGPGYFVILEISDTGHGIDPLIKERIFDPFFTTRDRTKYPGLGLSTVYGIIEQSGGFISVDSEPAKGTTFRIYLPRIDAAKEAPSLEGPQPESVEGTETILVVDDNKPLREAIAKSMEMLGYKVLAAESGEHALEIVQRHEGAIHLMVTDMVMPGIDGRELFRSILRSRKMKALYLSGYTEHAVIGAETLGKEEAFLQKPVHMMTLARKIREMLGPVRNLQKI